MKTKNGGISKRSDIDNRKMIAVITLIPGDRKHAVVSFLRGLRIEDLEELRVAFNDAITDQIEALKSESGTTN